MSTPARRRLMRDFKRYRNVSAQFSLPVFGELTALACEASVSRASLALPLVQRGCLLNDIRVVWAQFKRVFFVVMGFICWIEDVYEETDLKVKDNILAIKKTPIILLYSATSLFLVGANQTA